MRDKSVKGVLDLLTELEDNIVNKSNILKICESGNNEHSKGIIVGKLDMIRTIRDIIKEEKLFKV